MSDDLKHVGVKGMKWGKRKTPRIDEQERKERKSDLKNRRRLSDKSLKEKIERLQQEKKFKDLTEEDISPGRKAVKEVLSQSGKRAAATLITGAALYAVKAALTKEVNLKDAAGYLSPKPGKK